jgi:flagellar basal-body rod protein FlgF
MQSNLYVSLSGQLSLLKRLETVANNVANLSTPGYRAERISFEEVLSETGLHCHRIRIDRKDRKSSRRGR